MCTFCHLNLRQSRSSMCIALVQYQYVDSESKSTDLRVIIRVSTHQIWWSMLLRDS
jgi:hypothetical protein